MRTTRALGRRRQHLFKRGRWWWFRRRLPGIAAQALGRREVARSLGTTDYRVARRRAVEIEARFERLLLELEEVPMGTDDTLERIEAIAARFLEDFVRRDREGRHEWRPRGEDAVADFHESLFHELVEPYQAEGERMHEGDRSGVEPIVQELLQQEGASFEDEDLDRFRYAVQRTLILALQTCAAEWEAEFAGRPRPPAPWEERASGGVRRGGTSSAGGGSRSKRLHEVVDTWLAREGPGWRGTTRSETRRYVEWLKTFLGNPPLESISRSDMGRFEATLRRLPRGFPADGEIREYEHAELPAKPLQTTKQMSRLQAFFNWTVANELIERSPAKGLVKKKTRREAKDARHPLSMDDLRVAFGEGYYEQSIGTGKPERYWLPLIALYTGARRSEIGQLLRRDLAEVEGVLCLSITDAGEGQRLKTPASRRLVPVHPHLIELGVLEYAKALKPGELLLPGRQTKAGWGVAASQWFIRARLREQGIEDWKKVFHSLRHSVVTALARAGVREPVALSIVGHEGDDATTTSLYDAEPAMQEKVAAVRALDWWEAVGHLRQR